MTTTQGQRANNQADVRIVSGHTQFVFPGPALNSNDRLGWRKKNDWTQVHKEEARLTALSGLARHQIHVCQTPVVIFHRRWTINKPSRIDASNIQPAAKAIVDGLVAAGFLIDDSGRYVHMESFLAPLKHAPCSAVLTTIVPIALFLSNPTLSLNIAEFKGRT